jgi:hypothetical protein
MSYRLFLDDERFPPDDGNQWVIVRTSGEAIDLLHQRGVPNYISFDHDLGGDDTAIPYVNALFDYVMDNRVVMPSGFDYYVHSQNVEGAKNIRGKMVGFINNVWADCKGHM